VAAGRKLGDAYIAVTADARGLGTDLSERASKALDDAARKMGETLDDRLREAVEDSTEGLGDTVGEELDRSTKRAGGRFSDNLKKSLTKAIGELPDIELGTDSTEVDHVLAGVRRDLAALRDATIGVDVDAAAALAQLDVLDAQLAQVAASSVDVNVRADALGAQAQLAAVLRQVRDLDGKDVNIKVDVDGAAGAGLAAAANGMRVTGQMAGFAGIAVKALVPVIAGVVLALGAILPVAVAGLGGIAALAAGAAAGLGVLALGFSGVGDTMKLLARREDALASAVGGGGRAAGAAESATRALTNARENAAEAAVRAAERVARAQEDVGRADAEAAARTIRALRDVEDAQRDLIAAREEARRQQEDLALSVTGNALAQRRAAIAVTEAELGLQRVMRDRRATDAMREAAQLAYDEQLHRQAELRLAGRRLADEQADAAEKGVDGSDSVVDAQRRLLEAQEEATAAQEEGARRVLDATRAVIDALREQDSQARQSAYSIASAQAAVASSAVAAGGAGSAALAAINRELAKVNPATLAFAEFLADRVQPAIERIKGIAAAGLLPGVQRGIEALEPLLPRFERIVGGIATKLGDLFTQAGERLNSPFWTSFFDDLEAHAGPILQDLSDAAWNVAEGFAGIVQAFFGVSDELGDGLVGVTEDFAEWGRTLKDNPEFQEFIDNVKESWPEIVEGAKEFGAALGDLWTFFEENGPTILAILRSVGDVVEDISDLLNPEQWAAEFETAGATISGWGEAIADGIIGGLSTLGDKATELWQGFVDGFREFFGIHSPSTLFTEIGGWLVEGLMVGLATLGERLVAVLTGAWTSGAEAVSTGIDTVVRFVTGLPGRAGEALSGLGGTLAGLFTGAFGGARDAVGRGIETVLGFIRGLPGRIAGALGNLGSLLSGAGGDLIRGLVNGISAAANFAGDVGRTVVNSVVGYINRQVIDRINDLLEFSIAGVTINPPDIPRIPLLANGAIVDRPTLAVVGEAGPEAVIPLSANRAGRRAALLEQAGLGGGAPITVDARQYYTVRDTPTAEAIGAVVGQRVVRDVRNGINHRYTRSAA
jgi:hypothetical protein